MSYIALDSSPPSPWLIVGGPPPGTVTALAISPAADQTLFVGTRTGIFRTRLVDEATPAHWQRLRAAPLEILALGISPQYPTDGTLVAGTGRGLFLSRDGGEHWQAAATPMPDPVVLCLAFSPNYAADGILLAGTLEDGIYYSDSRGERWSYRGFGLLDAAVYALAFSPNFAQDETLFAGTESALYYSYNGARAWKLLAFPEEAAPILSLAVSPHFAQNQTLYAGTEQHGLYRSPDLGQRWQPLALPATAVNALALSPQAGGLLAATKSGLYASSDGGEEWRCLLDQPDAFSLAMQADLLITGFVNLGAWATRDQATWEPIFTLPARALTGLAISPHFDRDLMAFLYGAQEGIWRSQDGGRSWSARNDHLPTLDIRSLAIFSGLAEECVLLAATADGLLLSETSGDQWVQVTAQPAAHVMVAPDGKLIAVASSDGELQVATTHHGPWQNVPTPWTRQSRVLALTIDDNYGLWVALLDQTRGAVNIWTGQLGHLAQILSCPASPSPVVGFWLPLANSSEQVGYAHIAQQIWELQRSFETGAVNATLLFETEDQSKILSLTGRQTPQGVLLYACTGQKIYQYSGTHSWQTVHDFGDERAIALTLLPGDPDTVTAFALLLGGSVCRGRLECT